MLSKPGLAGLRVIGGSVAFSKPSSLQGQSFEV